MGTRVLCLRLAVGCGAVALGAALACGPSKPPMTPDSETDQQLPDIDAAMNAAPPPAPTGK